MTKLTRHETLDLFDMALRNRPGSVHKNSEVEFKSWRKVSREAGLSKLGTILCDPTSDLIGT